MYQLVINNTAQNQLEKLSFNIVKRISVKVLELRNNPRPYGYKKLHDEKGYRIRIGDYRVLYEIEEAKQLVVIYKIAHRKDIYR